jgi:hypothetical protein
MKNTFLVVAGVVAGTSLGGCASMSPQELANYDNGVDTPRVAAINKFARARGVEIHWINYPLRKPAAAAPVVPALGESTGT